MKDITIIYITANKLTDSFAKNIRKELLKAAGEIPIISVSKKPLKFGVKNLVFPGEASIYNEYKETLAGVKEAKTKYVAICEDDSLYSSLLDGSEKRPLCETCFDMFEKERENLIKWGV